MRIENLKDFISEATTSDLILTGTILFIIVIIVCGNLYMIFNIKRWLKRLENEIQISNRHLAHLDPNKYPDSRENYYN